MTTVYFYKIRTLFSETSKKSILLYPPPSPPPSAYCASLFFFSHDISGSALKFLNYYFCNLIGIFSDFMMN